MLASRIASLFTRTEITKNPEPTKPKLVRDKSSIEDKRTAASVHVSQQLDDESTKNIKCQFKKRPVPNNLDTQSEKLNTAYQFNSNDSKILQSEAPISEKNSTPKIPEETIDNRSRPDLYQGFLDGLPAAGRERGETYGLNECEMAAIVCYTGDDYKEINETLRSLTGKDVNFYNADSLKSFGLNEHLSEIISDLSNGLKKLPPARTDSERSYGLGRDITLKGDALKRMKEGAVISDRMFTSTTTRLEQTVEGDWWSNNDQVWTIHQRVDGNGRDIAAFSGYGGEGEILFLPDTKFLITYRKDDTVVGKADSWKYLFLKLHQAFFDEFPKQYVDQLDSTEIKEISAALGLKNPLNFESAAALMEKIFPGKFFIKSDTNKNDKGPEEIEINIVNLQSLSEKLIDEKSKMLKTHGAWGSIVFQLHEAFFKAFPEEYVKELDVYEKEVVKAALGTLHPLDFKSAAEKMKKKFPEKFFLESATNEKNEDPEKITIDLEVLYSLGVKLHAEEYGGALEPGTGFTKIVIGLQEISPDDEVKINLEKSRVSSKNEVTSGIPSNTPNTSQSGRKIPVRGQNNPSGKTEGKILLKRPNTKSAETERKIPIRDQSKTTAQPSTAAKPSSTNKPNLSDDYSPPETDVYIPGFRE